MLTCEGLYNCSKNPRINDIELNLLREYYEYYLMGRDYLYNIVDDKNNNFNITLRFTKKNFCHLLGIETIVKRNVRSEELGNYKSDKGWNNIIDGSLDFAKLKRINKKKFNSVKDKFVFFYLLPKIIMQPKLVVYDRLNVRGGTLIECKMLFYDNIQNAYVHLGLEYSEEDLCYIPRTFFIERITQNSDGMRFIVDQQSLKIVNINVIEN